MADEKDDDFVHMRIRIRKSLHDKLGRTSTSRGASMNSEIVERLDRSLRADEIIGGPITEDRELLGIVRLIAAAMHDTGRNAAFSATFSAEITQRWLDNPFAFDQAAQAASTIIEAFRPRGLNAAPDHKDQTGRSLRPILENMGKAFARSAIAAVMADENSFDDANRASIIRADLGRLLERIGTHGKKGSKK